MTQRILIMGLPGAGKTYLATELKKLLEQCGKIRDVRICRDRCTMVPLVFLHMVICLDGEIGRHKRLKISRRNRHAGSIPAPGTSVFVNEIVG